MIINCPFCNDILIATTGTLYTSIAIPHSCPIYKDLKLKFYCKNQTYQTLAVQSDLYYIEYYYLKHYIVIWSNSPDKRIMELSLPNFIPNNFNQKISTLITFS